MCRLSCRACVKRQLADNLQEPLNLRKFSRWIGALSDACQEFINRDCRYRAITRRMRPETLKHKRVIPHCRDARVGVKQVFHGIEIN